MLTWHVNIPLQEIGGNDNIILHFDTNDDTIQMVNCIPNLMALVSLKNSKYWWRCGMLYHEWCKKHNEKRIPTMVKKKLTIKKNFV
jgi:hypothetical protein